MKKTKTNLKNFSFSRKVSCTNLIRISQSDLKNQKLFVSTFTKDGLKYGAYRIPVVNQTIVNPANLPNCTSLLSQPNLSKGVQNRSDQTGLSNWIGSSSNSVSEKQLLNDQNQASQSADDRKPKVLSQRIVFNPTDIRCYTEIEKQFLSREHCLPKVLRNYKPNQRVQPNQKADSKIFLNQATPVWTHSKRMTSIKLPEPIKRQQNSLICACQTDPNNNITKDLSCLNHLDNQISGDVSSDRALSKALSSSLVKPNKTPDQIPAKSNNAANVRQENNEGIRLDEMKDQNNNEVSHQKRRMGPDGGGSSTMERSKGESYLWEDRGDDRKGVRASESSVGDTKDRRASNERTEERLPSKRSAVEQQQRELNRKVISSFLKPTKNQGTIASNLIKSLPIQLMAIGIASGMPKSSGARHIEVTENVRINRGSAEPATGTKLIRRDADLNSGGANNRNHNSKRELASAAHHAASHAGWQPDGNHGDCRTCVVPVGNKKTTKKSSLIIVSPFHQKPDKSQIKKSNKIEQANQRRCKLNGQAAVPSSFADRYESSHCFDCASRASAVQCASEQNSERNCEPNRKQNCKPNCERNCERQCDSKNNCKQPIKVKRGQASANRMDETAENKEQSGGQSKVEPETAVPNKPIELASLSKQNSLDSPAKSTSNSTATNSPSVESVWSNLREDYELGEVIGKFGLRAG